MADPPSTLRKRKSDDTTSTNSKRAKTDSNDEDRAIDSDRTASSEPTWTHCLTPKADMVVVVGESATRIRVNSLRLTAGSKVFAVMLGPNFKEGHELAAVSGKQLYELQLPDDDADTTLYVLMILHHRVAQLPTKFKHTELYGIAKFAVKYDCVDLLKPTIMFRWPVIVKWNFWFEDVDPHFDTTETDLKCLASASVFGLNEKFSIYANNIACTCSDSLGAYENEESLQYLPPRILWTISDLRSAVYLKLADFAGLRILIDDLECFPRINPQVPYAVDILIMEMTEARDGSRISSDMSKKIVQILQDIKITFKSMAEAAEFSLGDIRGRSL